jgi:hypothetical protein
MMKRSVLLCAALAAGLSAPAFSQAPAGPQMSPQDLSNLVAPIALYPDMLLSQVLAASTYPLEIGQARLWMQQNPGLHGQQLVDAAKQQNWDPSVQALVAFPDVIDLLTRDYQWTTALGNAFLAQQAAVMDAIQQLRASAQSNGRLTNTPQQRVTYEQQNGQSAIVIQPANPQMVYAPAYNPAYVWGPPAYGYYPALDYPSPGYGIIYGVGTFLGGLFAGLLSFGGWGWGLSWLGHGLFLNGLFFSHFGFHGYGGSGSARTAWVHNASHRLGVPYGGRSAGASFGGRSYGASGSRASSGYQGSSRQMEAYRGLTAAGARSGGYSASSRGFASSSAPRGGFGSGRGWAEPSSHYSAARYSGGGSRSSHYSAPKSSGHSGGGGHNRSSGGGGHSHGGGGHSSHGGGHKK